MKNFIFVLTVLAALSFWGGSVSTAQATNTQNICTWSDLEVLPYPDPTNWNFTGQFQVTNKANYPMTFSWLLDMWGNASQNQNGTTTLQPGESQIYGFGNICPKWQFDVWCGDKEWGAIVESNTQACMVPSPTPVVSPSPTPIVSPSPSPSDAGIGGNSNPSPTPSASSDSNQSNSNSSNSNSNQATVAAAGGSDILSITTLAGTGTIEDSIAMLAGVLGLISMAAGTAVYAKKNT